MIYTLCCAPFFTSDAVVLGLLLMVLAWVFHTSSSDKAGWKRFYTFVPALVLCYFLPALLHWPLGLIASEWHDLSKVMALLTEAGLNFPSNASMADLERIISEYNSANPDSAITQDALNAAAKKKSYLYNPVTSRYLLPASLILLCLSIDLKAVMNLGTKALIMFFAATIGIIIGGPIALLVITSIAPEGFIQASSDV